jgi:hypothetical protein
MYHYLPYGEIPEPTELRHGPLFVVAFDSWAQFRRDLSLWRLQHSAKFGLIEQRENWSHAEGRLICHETYGRFDRLRGYGRERFLYRLKRLRREPHPEFGPEYPDLGATVAKYRRNNDPRYGEAMSKALRALQHKELVKGLPPRETLPPIYRGSDKKRAAYFRAQSRRAAIARLTQDLRKRTPKEEIEAYERAMKQKLPR